MDVTIVNTPLPVSAEIKVKNFQIPWNLLLNRQPGLPAPAQPLVIKNENTDYDLLISYVYAANIGSSTIIGLPPPTSVGLGILITDNTLPGTNKSSTLLLIPNALQLPGVLTSIVVKAHQKCSFFLAPDNGSTDLRANFFVSGMMMRS